MQSHQSFNFTVALAIGLGAALSYVFSSATAIGYPASSAVSTGSNPVWSKGGEVDGVTISVMDAPSDQDVVITDVVLSFSNSNCYSRVEIRTDTGDILAFFRLRQTDEYYRTSEPTSIQHSFNSGLPVPAGQTLVLQEYGGCDVAYTLSGYYAQP
jgi:hypothetical protein